MSVKVVYRGEGHPLSKLPFVRRRPGRSAGLEMWVVKPSGDMATDAEQGNAFGIAFLELVARGGPEFSIVSIAGAQDRQSTPEGCSLICGFWKPILLAACDAYRSEPQRYRAIGPDDAAFIRERRAEEEKVRHARASKAARKGARTRRLRRAKP